jgi:hypothetical protein
MAVAPSLLETTIEPQPTEITQLNYGSASKWGPKFGRVLFRLAEPRNRFFHRLMRHGVPIYRVNQAFNRLGRVLGQPVDQTLGPAFAQIQVVARKTQSRSTS